MAVINHLHSYIRANKIGGSIYRCSHPDCTHWTRKEFLLGKRAMCECGEAFILEQEMLKLKVPHCFKCMKPYKPNSVISQKRQAEIAKEAMLKRVDEILNEEIASVDAPVGNSDSKSGGYEI